MVANAGRRESSAYVQTGGVVVSESRDNEESTIAPHGLSYMTNLTAFISSLPKGLTATERNTLIDKQARQIALTEYFKQHNDDFRLVKELEDFRDDHKRTEFERKHGFPRSWHLFDLKRIKYQEVGDLQFYMIETPSMVKLGARGFTRPKRRPTVGREKIVGYTLKSRRTLLEKLLSVDWSKIPKENVCEATLTYPAVYPKDGKTVKRHLDTIAKRLDREWKERGGITFAWKLEFQRRGAPHYHLLIVLPRPVDKTALREWFAENWSNIVLTWMVQSEGIDLKTALKEHGKNLRAGISLDTIRKTAERLVGYFVTYLAGTGIKAKDHQHEVPEEYEDVGRWWGLRGVAYGLMPFDVKAVPLTLENFLSVREGMDAELMERGVRLSASYWYGRTLYKRSEIPGSKSHNVLCHNLLER